MDARSHWQDVWSRRDATETSWYQDEPRTSLELIERAGTPHDAPVLDVGGGASRLVDHLLARGFSDVSVLDVADAALEQARTRLGADAERASWLAADVTRAELAGPYRLWHDRAVFHFLTDAADRDRYRAALARAVPPGGHAVLATFAPDGPETCSGLPVRRHGADALAAEAGPGWRLLEARREVHRTPWDAPQPFQYVLLERL